METKPSTTEKVKQAARRVTSKKPDDLTWPQMIGIGILAILAVILIIAVGALMLGLAAALVGVAVCIIPFLLMIGWNAVIPTFFTAPPLTFTQAGGIFILFLLSLWVISKLRNAIFGDKTLPYRQRIGRATEQVEDLEKLLGEPTPLDDMAAYRNQTLQRLAEIKKLLSGESPEVSE